MLFHGESIEVGKPFVNVEVSKLRVKKAEANRCLPVNPCRPIVFGEVFSRQMFTGEHDPIAIFLAAGGGVAATQDRGRISVLDIAPLIFHLAGSPVPDDLEGSFPEAWLADLERRPVRSVSASEMPGIDRALSGAPQSDPDLIQKLRKLGYIE